MKTRYDAMTLAQSAREMRPHIRDEDVWTDKGLAYAESKYIPPSAGEYGIIQLWNPTGSGVDVYLDDVLITAIDSVIVRVGRYNTALTSADNETLGYGSRYYNPRALVRYEHNASLVVSTGYEFRCTSNAPIRMPLQFPIQLRPGEGIAAAATTTEGRILIGYHWRELEL